MLACAIHNINSWSAASVNSNEEMVTKGEQCRPSYYLLSRRHMEFSLVRITCDCFALTRRNDFRFDGFFVFYRSSFFFTMVTFHKIFVPMSFQRWSTSFHSCMSYRAAVRNKSVCASVLFVHFTRNNCFQYNYPITVFMLRKSHFHSHAFFHAFSCFHRI